MIAYKLFRVNGDKFYPIVVDDCFYPYSKEFITVRADDSGPFAAFDTVKAAREFKAADRQYSAQIYKVDIKQSKDKELWFWNRHGNKQVMWWGAPNGTVFADEFEILERMQ